MRRAVLGLGVLIFFFGAWGGAQETFRLALGVNFSTLEPTANTGLVYNMLDYVLEPLVGLTQAGEVEPRLAESWEIAEDGRSVTFTLREGVTFHDGTPLDAAAVKFSLERWNDPEVRPPSAFNDAFVSGVEVVDERTVRVSTEFGAPLLLGGLTQTGYSVVSPASVTEYGNAKGEEGAYNHPVGTGPYVFDRWERGEKIVLEKYADYWGEAPYYDGVEFVFVPEAATRESLLLAGQADLILSPPVSDIPSLEANPEVEVVVAPSERVTYIAFTAPRVTDVRVRQALNYAVDTQAIADSLLAGIGQPMTSVTDKNNVGYCEQPAYGYDPDRARELLAEAGAENLQLNFAAPTGRFINDFDVAQAVGLYLQQVGVTATPTTSDYGTYISQLFVPAEAQTLDMHFLGYAPPVPDASLDLYFRFHQSQAAPAGLNTGYFVDDEVSELLDAALRETDPATRETLLCDIQTRIWAAAPVIFLHELDFVLAHRAGLTGVSYLPGEKFYTVYARPAE